VTTEKSSEIRTEISEEGRGDTKEWYSDNGIGDKEGSHSIETICSFLDHYSPVLEKSRNVGHSLELVGWNWKEKGLTMKLMKAQPKNKAF
jgi:hypothetical protein